MFDFFFGICGVDDAIVGALLTAASAAAGAVGAKQAQKSANRATQAELDRQAEYQKKATGVFEQSLTGSTPDTANEAISRGGAARAADYAKQQSVPLTGPGPAPVGGESSRLVSTAATGAQDRLSNAARARLAGYNEWDLQQAIKDLQAEQQLALIGNFSGGSRALLPMELQSAAHVGDTAQGIGSLLGMTGNLVSAYGAQKPRMVSSPGLSLGVHPDALIGSTAPITWNPPTPKVPNIGSIWTGGY